MYLGQVIETMNPVKESLVCHTWSSHMKHEIVTLKFSSMPGKAEGLNVPHIVCTPTLLESPYVFSGVQTIKYLIRIDTKQKFPFIWWWLLLLP